MLHLIKRSFQASNFEAHLYRGDFFFCPVLVSHIEMLSKSKNPRPLAFIHASFWLVGQLDLAALYNSPRISNNIILSNSSIESMLHIANHSQMHHALSERNTLSRVGQWAEEVFYNINMKKSREQDSHTNKISDVLCLESSRLSSWFTLMEFHTHTQKRSTSC